MSASPRRGDDHPTPPAQGHRPGQDLETITHTYTRVNGSAVDLDAYGSGVAGCQPRLVDSHLQQRRPKETLYEAWPPPPYGYAQSTTYSAYNQRSKAQVQSAIGLLHLSYAAVTDSYDTQPKPDRPAKSSPAPPPPPPASTRPPTATTWPATPPTRPKPAPAPAPRPRPSATPTTTCDRLTTAWTATDTCAATPTSSDHSTVGDGDHRGGGVLDQLDL